STGDLAIARHAGFIGNAFTGQVMFWQPHHGNFRDGINTDREMFRDRFDINSKGIAGDVSSLRSRGRREAWIPYDIAGREDMRDLGPELPIDLQVASLVCC